MEHKLSTMVANFIIRATFGSGPYLFLSISIFLPIRKILNVGLNALSVLTSGTLGIPRGAPPLLNFIPIKIVGI